MSSKLGSIRSDSLGHQVLEALRDTVLESSLLVCPLSSLGRCLELSLGVHLSCGGGVFELGLAVDNVGVGTGSLSGSAQCLHFSHGE